MMQINLLNWRAQRRKRRRNGLIISLSINACCCLLLSSMLAGTHTQPNKPRTAVTQTCQLQQLQQQWQHYQQRLSQQRQRRQRHNQLIDTLTRISRSMHPPNTQLQSLTLESKQWALQLLSQNSDDSQHVINTLNQQAGRHFSLVRIAREHGTYRYTIASAPHAG